MAATKRRPATSKRRRYDWSRARALYVEGVEEEGELVYPTLRMVARLLDYEPARVREKSSKDGWVGARAAHQAELARTRQEARRRRVAETAVDLDLRALAAARAGVEAASRQIGDLLRLVAQREAEGGPEADRLLDRQIAVELGSLSLALRRFHHTGLAALGERGLTHPDDETAESYLEASLDASHARLLDGFRSFRERYDAGDVAGAIEAVSTPAGPDRS